MVRAKRLLFVALALVVLGFLYWKFAIPAHRVEVRSELVMLGDLDGDRRWGPFDLTALESYLQEPFAPPEGRAFLLDLNQNGLVDKEDLAFLRALVASGGDPYGAQEAASAEGRPFPRPRELYRYLPVQSYRTRPLFALPYPQAGDSVLGWLGTYPLPTGGGSYEEVLKATVYEEAVRFDRAWRRRAPDLLPLEREYATTKLARAEALRAAGDDYGLLLALIELVEDAETLTVRGQPEVTLQILALRDHLRVVLGSPTFEAFAAGRSDWRPVLQEVARHVEADLGLKYDFETLAPPRNLTHLQNYLDRAEWQYYKSSPREEAFRSLIDYAQNDPRYLRCVARTSRRHQDPNVENHNLPMVLLFREALRIEGGDKRRAIGLLDESIRIPYAWVKSIPREVLPGSLALDNFLLPGNKEDGADKSRHWNVFGGVCVYKSPRESIDLALKREMADLREDGHTPEAMREFLRDMIANLNGMYHVMSVQPDLVYRPPQSPEQTGRAFSPRSASGPPGLRNPRGGEGVGPS